MLDTRVDDLTGESTLELLALLYRKRGFMPGEAFAEYRRSAFNQFLHLEL